MGLRREYDGHRSFTEYPYEEEEDAIQLSHKKQVKKMLEEKLERKRLKEELDDELYGEFDWDDLDR
ncbi:MAG: hypothetical protein WC785_00910 [Tatlockia sp.]|jgi:predicted  nucleic acid-binding Zn-ribbon protein